MSRDLPGTGSNLDNAVHRTYRIARFYGGFLPPIAGQATLLHVRAKLNLTRCYSDNRSL